MLHLKANALLHWFGALAASQFACGSSGASALLKELSPLIASVTLHFLAASAAIFLTSNGAITALLFGAV